MTTRWWSFLLLVGGCTAHPVSVREISAVEGAYLQRRDALDGALSRGSVNLLHDLDALELLDATPEAVIAALRARSERDPDTAVLLAELLLLQASRLPADAAAACCLEAALAVVPALHAPPAELALDPRRELCAELYGFALTRWLGASELRLPPHRWGTLAGIGRRFAVDVAAAEGVHRSEAVDWIRPASLVAFRGLRSRHVRQGLGVPLVAHTARESQPPELQRFYPPEGCTYPATLLLLPASGDRLVATLLDPHRAATCELGAARYPLAADFTAPYAHLLASAPLHALADRTFLDPDAETPHRAGVYLLEPYDPQKTPVVLIHGLWSSPLAWRDLTNEIWGDAEVSGRCQVWHYVYPTGAPILNNARDLRRALQEVRAAFDPEGDDRATDDVVLVGHSMGGVLAKTVVQSSGEAIWSVRFNRPLDGLDLLPEARAYATETFFFEPLPFVRRVVFLAAPHRGSLEADSFFGRVGAWLQGRTARVRGFAIEMDERNPGVSLGDNATPGSIDVLSPANAVLRALAELPIATGIPYHTVMGDVTGDSGLPPSDGVVENASSHLDGAASELVVRGAGHDVQQHPRAIAEVVRILREHCGGR